MPGTDFTPKSERAVIVEFDGSGHRFHYVRILAYHALRERMQVTLVVSARSSALAHLGVHMGSLLPSLEVVALEQTTWEAVEEIASSRNASITVVPDADRFLGALAKRLAWRGPGRLSLLIMRVGIERSHGFIRSRLRGWIKRAAIEVVDHFPRVSVWVLRSSLWGVEGRPKYVRDPVELTCTPADVSELQTSWDLAHDRYWFGVLGAISDRKNLPLIAEALKSGPVKPVGLLIAGEIESRVADQLVQINEALRTRGIAFRTVNRLLSDSELDAAVSAVDCIVLAHSNDGPSGLLGKALAAGTRVVAAGSATLREDSKRSPETTAWSELNVHELGANLGAAVTLGRPAVMRMAASEEFASRLLS